MIGAQNSAVASHTLNLDHRIDFSNCRFVYKSNHTKTRRVAEGVLINSLETFTGNKSFTSEDPYTRKMLIKEMRLNISNINNNQDSHSPDHEVRGTGAGGTNLRRISDLTHSMGEESGTPFA